MAKPKRYTTEEVLRELLADDDSQSDLDLSYNVRARSPRPALLISGSDDGETRPTAAPIGGRGRVRGGRT